MRSNLINLGRNILTPMNVIAFCLSIMRKIRGNVIIFSICISNTKETKYLLRLGWTGSKNMNFYGRNKRKLVRELKSLCRNVIMQVPFPVPLILNNCCLLHISIAFPPPPLPQHFCFPSSSNYTLSILNRPYIDPASTLRPPFLSTKFICNDINHK